MSLIDPPDFEPRKFTAGETVRWTKSLGDYPASDGWTLKYFLRGPGEHLDVTCTTDGDDFEAEISATNTAKLAAGQYWLQGRVENAGGEKFVVYDQAVTVKANLSESTNAYDGNTKAKQILDAIDALMLGKASIDQQEYMIGAGSSQRMLKRIAPAELLELRKYYASIVNAENRRRKNKSFRSIKIGFRNPR